MQSQLRHKDGGILADHTPVNRRNRRLEESGTAYAFRVLLDDPEFRETFNDFMVPKAGINGEGEENWRNS